MEQPESERCARSQVPRELGHCGHREAEEMRSHALHLGIAPYGDGWSWAPSEGNGYLRERRPRSRAGDRTCSHRRIGAYGFTQENAHLRPSGGGGPRGLVEAGGVIAQERRARGQGGQRLDVSEKRCRTWNGRSLADAGRGFVLINRGWKRDVKMLKGTDNLDLHDMTPDPSFGRGPVGA